MITTLIFAASYGIASVPSSNCRRSSAAPKGHAAILATAKAAQDKAVAEAQAAGKPAPDAKRLRQIGGNATDEAVAKVSIWQEIGGLVGRFLLALLAVPIVSRRALLRCFQIPALVVVPFLFWWISQNLGQAESLQTIKIGIFIAGLFTVSPVQLLGNYIPRVFPVHLRGTGESFAANIGGRIPGTAAAWITITFPSRSLPARRRSHSSARWLQVPMRSSAPSSPSGFPNLRPNPTTPDRFQDPPSNGGLRLLGFR